MPETPNIQLDMSPKTAKILAWVAWALVLLGTLSGAVAAFAWVSAGWQQAASGASVLALLAAAEIRRQLPSARAIKAGPAVGAVVLFVALSAVAVSCKPPPLAVAYRAHTVGLKAYDATGETIAASQKAAFLKCELKHNPLSSKQKLLDCYKAAREPLAVYVNHIKPALKVALAAFWGVLETVYASGKDISKTDLAVIAACESVTAAETALTTYKDKLGKHAGTIVAAVAGIKLFVCR